MRIDKEITQHDLQLKINLVKGIGKEHDRNRLNLKTLSKNIGAYK